MADPPTLHIHVHSERVASVLTDSGRQVAYCRGADAVPNARLFALAPLMAGALRPFADAWRVGAVPVRDYVPYANAAEVLDELEDTDETA